jgi:release factor glutamine methyltransferase
VQLGETLKSAIQRLTAADVPSPRLNAELLLMFTVGCDRAYLYGHPDRELTEEEQSRYDAALAQRSQGIPAQYITGHQEFWGMDFIVSPAVLIPRPETEHVIERVLELINARVAPDALVRGPHQARFSPDGVVVRAGEPRSPSVAAHSAAGRVGAPAPTRGVVPTQMRIVDVGTGSGCIALAIAKELPQAELNATEISSTALEVARANAARHQLETRVSFHEADLLAGTETNSFDFVVSNPPYVGESEEDSVQLEVRKFEPRNAVFAGPTGTEVIERLIPQARDVLKPGGWLVMEISGTIADRVRELLSGWGDIQITNDLQGIPRVVSARKS